MAFDALHADNLRCLKRAPHYGSAEFPAAASVSEPLLAEKLRQGVRDGHKCQMLADDPYRQRQRATWGCVLRMKRWRKAAANVCM